MTDIDLISYLLVFALSIIFSGFAVERKSSVFSFLSMISWFMLAICHVGVATSSSFISLAYMFVGIGFFFFIFGFALVLSAFQDKKRAQEWEIP